MLWSKERPLANRGRSFCELQSIGLILTYICSTQKEEEIFMHNSSRYIAVDVETSGLSVQRGGRVIEIGAVVLQGGVIVAEFGSLIDTGASISYGAFLVPAGVELLTP
jgi:DNA polymerase III epsilon subunit-like protein